jgi:hypothetical protein
MRERRASDSSRDSMVRFWEVRVPWTGDREKKKKK